MGGLRPPELPRGVESGMISDFVLLGKWWPIRSNRTISAHGLLKISSFRPQTVETLLVIYFNFDKLAQYTRSTAHTRFPASGLRAARQRTNIQPNLARPTLLSWSRSTCSPSPRFCSLSTVLLMTLRRLSPVPLSHCRQSDS